MPEWTKSENSTKHTWGYKGKIGQGHCCKTAQFFYLISAWELILNTYRGPGYAQFGWSIFFNRRWLLEWCVYYILSAVNEIKVKAKHKCRLKP